MYLSDPGGVGKSHLIKLVQSDLLKFSQFFEPDDVVVLLTSPTGVASYNIHGQTLHSALPSPVNKYHKYKPLKFDKLNTLRSRPSHLATVIIDECSMMGSNMLLQVNQRLQQIKDCLPDDGFGHKSILAVSDLHHLPPALQPMLFEQSSNAYASLYNSGSLWKDFFKIFELTEIVRQKVTHNLLNCLGD